MTFVASIVGMETILYNTKTLIYLL